MRDEDELVATIAGSTADALLLIATGMIYAQQELFSRASDCVDRILRGAKAANTPVEQPLRYDFIVNLKTVRAMGLTIPRALRIRADEMIE